VNRFSRLAPIIAGIVLAIDVTPMVAFIIGVAIRGF
jgi:hypothetical protein